MERITANAVERQMAQKGFCYDSAGWVITQHDTVPAADLVLLWAIILRHSPNWCFKTTTDAGLIVTSTFHFTIQSRRKYG